MDKQIYDILGDEIERQNETIELIASENFASEAVRNLCGSVFTNKYAEGYPGRRYYNGCENMDAIESLAISRVCDVFGSDFANVQPHSGANANTAVYQAFLKPGDRILGMDLASGGHLSHGASVNQSGKIYEAHSYGVNEEGFLDYESIAEQAAVIKPQLIVAGASAYPRQIQWELFREIADNVGAKLLVDMAHYSGLIAGKAYQNPIDYADVVTSTTHKTLRGPRGGIILWNNPGYTKRINSAIFPGTQGGPLMNIIAAKAQCFIEALSPEFTKYARQVKFNAQCMARKFTENNIELQTAGTDSHLLLLNLSNTAWSGKALADRLEAQGITVNKNGVPNDQRSFTETSGIRIGTAAETTRGKDEVDFMEIAINISDIINEGQ
jgi:glycine hydroxymethyltransferase